MSDCNTKKRLARAKKRAITILERAGYSVIPSDNGKFCLIGIRGREARLIKVVIDYISENDIKIIKEFPISDIYTKEIWLKRRNDPNFEIKEVC